MTILVGDIKDVGLSPTEGTVTVFRRVLGVRIALVV